MLDDPQTSETTTSTAAPAPAEVATETAPVETTSTEAAAPTETPDATAPDETVAEAQPTESTDAAPVIPDEIQAQLSEFEAEQKAWGPQWSIRDLARDATRAFLTEDGDTAIKALMGVSAPKTFGLISTILEAGAAKHVAAEHGMSPQELATLLGPPVEIPLTRAIERAIDAMPDDEAAEAVREVFEQNALLKRQLADAKGVVKEARGELQSYQNDQSVGKFVNDYTTWHNELIGELVEEVPSKALESIYTVVTTNFKNDPAAIDAVAKYSAAVGRGENPRVLETTFRPAVRDALRAVMEKELIDVRGYKAKEQPTAPKGASKPGPKLIGATPGKPPASAPAPAAPPPTGSERVVPAHHKAALEIAADIATARAARQSTGA